MPGLGALFFFFFAASNTLDPATTHERTVG
jgi:hypothetical protein